MIYIIYFILTINFLFPFDYSFNQKSIENLKKKTDLLIESENFDLALDLYLKILEFERAIYQEDSNEIAETYDAIANLYILLNNYSAALPYVKKSINIYEKKILQPKDKLLSSLKNISIIYQEQNSFDLLNKSDELIESLEIIDNPYSINELFVKINDFTQTAEDTAFTYIDLAKSYKDRGLYTQSAENFSKALDLKNSHLNFEYYYNLQ